MPDESIHSLASRMRLGPWVRYALKGLALTSLAGALVLGFSVEKADWRRLTEFPPWLVAVAFGMVILAWVCNGVRTWIMARALGHHLSIARSVGITLSMEFAIAATPGGVGGWVTRAYLQGRAGIPLPATLSMMAADASADLLFFLLLVPFAIGATLELEPVRELLQEVDWSTTALSVTGVLLGIALLVWALAQGRWAKLLVRIPVPGRWRRFLTARLSGLPVRIRLQFREMRIAASFLLRERRGHYLVAFLFAAVQWTCRYGILPLVLWGLGSAVAPLALVLLQGCLFLMGLLVMAPGGGGSLEVLTTLILEPLVGVALAALAVVLWRLFTYYLYLLGGAAAFFVMFLGIRSEGKNRGGAEDGECARGADAESSEPAPE